MADGAWVRQSSWVWSNAIAVGVEAGLILIDPGINGVDLDELADDVDRLGLPMIAGFSTHPHWDHLLWHPRLGDVPRFATTPCAKRSTEARELAQARAAESATGIPLELVALVTPLPEDGGPLRGGTRSPGRGSAPRGCVVVPGHGAVAKGPEMAHQSNLAQARSA